MLRRWLKRLGLVMVLAMPWPAASVELAEAPARIVAVGDLHGDFAAWRAIARDAGLVDARGRWVGGRTLLVQMGDVPDRGPDSRAIMQDLIRLSAEAPRKGGRIIALVGNHESMMMTGDLAYVSAGEFASFADRASERRRAAVFEANRTAIEAAYRARDPAMEEASIRAAWMAATPLGSVELQAAWHPKGVFGRWVLGNPAVARVGDTLFVHGGVSPAHADWPPARINAEVAKALAERSQDRASIIHAEDGPLWYRGLAGKDAGVVAAELTTTLEKLGAKRMVIAHTPHLAGILLLHDGRLARIDTGISAAYGGTLSWLEILGDRMVAHAVQRPAEGAAP